MILLHRVRDGYLTLVDIFRTVISAGQLEQLLAETGSRLSMTAYVAAISKLMTMSPTASRLLSTISPPDSAFQVSGYRSRMVTAAGRTSDRTHFC